MIYKDQTCFQDCTKADLVQFNVVYIVLSLCYNAAGFILYTFVQYVCTVYTCTYLVSMALPVYII